MSDPWVYEVGCTDDFDEIQVHVGVDYDLVSIQAGQWASGAGIRLDLEGAERFAQLFARACWEAGRQKGERSGVQ